MSVNLTKPSNLIRHSALGVALATALLAGCTDGGTSKSGNPSSGAVATAEMASGPAGLGGAASRPVVANPATQRSVDVGTTFDYGSFRITIGHVVFDRDLQAVGIGARVHNTAGVWRQTTWPGAALRIADKEHVLFGPVIDLPPGALVDVTLTAELVSGDPLAGDPLARGVFHLGAPTDLQIDIPLVALAERPADAEKPFVATPVVAEGWASIGKYSVHVTGAMLLTSAPEVGATPLRDERVLRLTYDLFAIRQDPVQGFGASEHLKLKRPDGKTVDPLSASSIVFPVSWSAFVSNTVDFAVPANVDGNYSLSLSSLSPIGLVPNPSAIERVDLPLAIALGEATVPPLEPSAIPDLTLLRNPTKSSASPSAGTSKDAVDVDLDRRGNPTGFTVQVKGMRRPAGSTTVTLDVVVKALAWDLPPAAAPGSTPGSTPGSDPERIIIEGAAKEARGLLAVDPQFSPTVALIAGGQVLPGTIDTKEYGIPETGRTMSFVFTSLSSAVPTLDDATLVIGNRTVRPAYVPLGDRSPMPLDPVAPGAGVRIDSPSIVSDHWSVKVRSSRLGLFSGDVPVGKVQLELDLVVTIASTAKPGSLGLTFRPEAQVFLARSDGYLVQPVKTAAAQAFEPGATHALKVVFTLDAGVLDRRGAADLDALMIRSRDESGDIPDRITETLAPVGLLGP